MVSTNSNEHMLKLILFMCRYLVIRIPGSQGILILHIHIDNMFKAIWLYLKQLLRHSFETSAFLKFLMLP